MSYFNRAYDDIDAVIEECRKHLPLNEIDTLVGTGLSGACAIPVIARALGLNWAIVRKDNDGAHSSKSVEGLVGMAYCFVDDFIETGSTYRRVTAAMKRLYPSCEHVGSYTYQYREDGYQPANEMGTVRNTFSDIVEVVA